MLLTIDDVLSPEEVSLARQWLQDASWASGQITAGVNAAPLAARVIRRTAGLLAAIARP